ncbi:MAG: hypothetical protein R3206_11095, partial [Salegentibacter mishustinae]|nr:hypothetical protein [Salegentibacter mishustinae]
ILKSATIKLQSRVQYSRTQNHDRSSTSGIILSQDIRYIKKRFQVDYRFAIFETDDYENRQYIYVKDVRYAFSIPAHQNKGIRTYIMVKTKPLKMVTIYVKWSQFYYFGVTEIGSGNSKIKGNRRSDLKVQLIWDL